MPSKPGDIPDSCIWDLSQAPLPWQLEVLGEVEGSLNGLRKDFRV